MSQLCCPVCLEEYTTEGLRVPCSLSCGHSFCRADLESLLDNERFVRCPICRVVSATEITPNYGLMEALAVMPTVGDVAAPVAAAVPGVGPLPVPVSAPPLPAGYDLLYLPVPASSIGNVGVTAPVAPIPGSNVLQQPSLIEETNNRLSQMLQVARDAGDMRRAANIEKEIGKNIRREEKQQLKEVRAAEKQIKKDIKVQQKILNKEDKERIKAEKRLTRLASGGRRFARRGVPVLTPVS